MNEPKNKDPIVERMSPAGQSESGDYFAAPLGLVRSGRLRFVRGASNVTIYANSSMGALYRAHFEGPVPSVRVEGGTVTIWHPRSSHPFDWRRYAAQVTLNGSIPWRIEFRGGLSRLAADLCELRLGSFEVNGGASHVALTLSRPSGTVPIRVLGGASNVAIRRPKGVAARVRVGGGATKLSLDEQHFGAIGSDVNLQTPDYESAADWYDIAITGGANNLTIEAR